MKFLGHPVHPMLVAFPLGLFIVGLIFDVLYIATQRLGYAQVAYYNIAAGIIGGLAAALFGLLDWLSVPDGTRAKRIGLLHGVGNAVVVLMFIVSWLIRRNDPNQVPNVGAFVLALAGVGLIAVTGWLGGEMVDRLGIGVDQGAHPNAPNSLLGQPADSTSSTDVTRAGHSLQH